MLAAEQILLKFLSFPCCLAKLVRLYVLPCLQSIKLVQSTCSLPVVYDSKSRRFVRRHGGLDFAASVKP